jgi:hypothetical protein
VDSGGANSASMIKKAPNFLQWSILVGRYVTMKVNRTRTCHQSVDDMGRLNV